MILLDRSFDNEFFLITYNDLYVSFTIGPFDNAEQVHLRILQTIYKQLTGDRLDCPRYGRHWELIGFQGT